MAKACSVYKEYCLNMQKCIDLSIDAFFNECRMISGSLLILAACLI